MKYHKGLQTSCKKYPENILQLPNLLLKYCHQGEYRQPQQTGQNAVKTSLATLHQVTARNNKEAKLSAQMLQIKETKTFHVVIEVRLMFHQSDVPIQESIIKLL